MVAQPNFAARVTARQRERRVAQGVQAAMNDHECPGHLMRTPDVV
jgi:hypothetical protein